MCPAGMLQKGQLGHGDQLHRNIPTVVEKLQDMHIVGGRPSHHFEGPDSAFAESNLRPLLGPVHNDGWDCAVHCGCHAGSGGKHHTVVVTKDGRSLAFGSNLMGQCGTGALKSRDKVEGEQANPLPAGGAGCVHSALFKHQLGTSHTCLPGAADPLPLTLRCWLPAVGRTGVQLAFLLARQSGFLLLGTSAVGWLDAAAQLDAAAELDAAHRWQHGRAGTLPCQHPVKLATSCTTKPLVHIIGMSGPQDGQGKSCATSTK